MKPRSAVLAVSLIACGAATHAEAAPRAAAPAARTQLLQQVFDCKKLTDSQLRLACYDRAAGALDAAETAGEVVVIDRAQARSVRRQAFGLNLPSITLFSRGEREETLSRVQATLSGAHRNGEGRWVVTTTDDQVWRQSDTEELFRPPHQGSTLAVRRGALGSFFCNLDGQASVRCVRDR